MNKGMFPVAMILTTLLTCCCKSCISSRVFAVYCNWLVVLNMRTVLLRMW